MSDWTYSDAELDQYFKDPNARQSPSEGNTPGGDGAATSDAPPLTTSSKLIQARNALLVIGGTLLAVTLGILLYFFSLTDDLPALEKIENPDFQLATIAYTADGQELARYAQQNRSWATYDQIHPHVINALVSTEDKRFYDHWGIDLFRTFSGVTQTILGKFGLPFEQQGGSTITQQLARNLYNEEIGRRVTVERKLKEMVTAVYLEQRYTKREIIEMYLNTVEFGYNAFGIEAASRTFFGKDPSDLDALQSATLVGMLKGTTLYNPIRNPERARQRRNVVLSMMVREGHLTREYYEENREAAVGAKHHSSAVTASLAPYFAEYVHGWLNSWAEKGGYNIDIASDGLVVYTTIDGRLQEMAQAAVAEQMEGLQKVVDVEWSTARPPFYQSLEPYLNRTDYTPFAFFWEDQKDILNQFVEESPPYKRIRQAGLAPAAARDSLYRNTAFMDSLKADKSRLEAGLVSLDPRNGHVKAWVGGRDLEVDWYDHVATAKRQPGSTFKPFLYTAAIDNDYSPYYMLPDSTCHYVDPYTGDEWSPKNSGEMSGQMMTLRDGLAQSKNTISCHLVLEVKPSNVALYARRMGVKSDLAEVPALALGVSDVSLLEMTGAYATLANGGLQNDPVVVTRIEDRYGNVLYETEPTPREALSERTAYTMIDMMRGVVQYGTGRRINASYGLGKYDFAGKTGTTQNSADGWFILMHPDLVTGAWVGFNDRRMTFRTEWWGQGAHNALFLVGDFLRRASKAEPPGLSETRFPTPEEFGISYSLPTPAETRRNDRGRVGW